MARPGRPIESYRSSTEPQRATNSSFFKDVGRLARATGALARDHLLLARAEARQEGKRVAINVGVGTMALPFALTGLIMLSAALAIGLSRWLGAGWGFFIVGLLDLALAGAFGGWAALKLRGEPSQALPYTREELRKDREVARAWARRRREQPHAAPESAFHSDAYAKRTRYAKGAENGGVHQGDLR